METVQESNVKTIVLCHQCCNPMEPKLGNLKYRSSAAIDNDYPGTLFDVSYFWCNYCDEGRMSPDELDSDSKRELARNGQLVFVLAPVQTPSQRVRVVNWLDK